MTRISDDLERQVVEHVIVRIASEDGRVDQAEYDRLCGRYYQYPACCVENYVAGRADLTREKIETLPDPVRELIETVTADGYVPCLRCLDEMVRGAEVAEDATTMSIRSKCCDAHWELIYDSETKRFEALCAKCRTPLGVDLTAPPREDADE